MGFNGQKSTWRTAERVRPFLSIEVHLNRHNYFAYHGE